MTVIRANPKRTYGTRGLWELPKREMPPGFRWSNYNHINFHTQPRPYWVSKEKWDRGWQNNPGIPVRDQFEVYWRRKEIMYKPATGQHDLFATMLMLIFPREDERVLRAVLLWFYRDRLGAGEMARRLATDTHRVRQLFTIANQRLRSWVSSSGFQDELLTARGRLFTDESMDQEQEIRNVFFRG